MAPRRANENETPPPAVPGATVVVVPPIDNEGGEEDASEEIAEVAGRVTALETRITELASGEEAWRTTTITSLRQDQADLRATLETLAQNQPQQVSELRGELTRLSQEIAALKARREAEPEPEVIAAVITPPAVPPTHPSEQEDGQRGSHADSEPVIPPANPNKKRRRVL